MFLRLLSLGAGVQSTTIALMAAERDPRLDHLDGAIFADTGWEPAYVYDHLTKLGEVLESAGIPLHVVSNGNLRHDLVSPSHRYASIPYFVRNPDGGRGMGRRQCTNEYKLTPIRRKIRELLGSAPPDFKRVSLANRAEQWIGFSTDEIGRVGHTGRPVRYLYSRYPLLELGMSRADCQDWLHSRGWTSVAKSACIGCPYHGNRQWRELRDNRPAEWADAVELDRAIRKGGVRGLPLDGEAFLHESRVPLDLAPIDHVTRGERAEFGDPDGCSPYSCRSGSAVARTT